LDGKTRQTTSRPSRGGLRISTRAYAGRGRPIGPEGLPRPTTGIPPAAADLVELNWGARGARLGQSSPPPGHPSLGRCLLSRTGIWRRAASRRLDDRYGREGQPRPPRGYPSLGRVRVPRPYRASCIASSASETQSVLVADLSLGTRVARSRLVDVAAIERSQTPSGAQRHPWAMTWGVAFGWTPPRPRERQRAATTTAAPLPNCNSRNADREKDDAESEKRQSGDCPHFHATSLSRFMPQDRDAEE